MSYPIIVEETFNTNSKTIWSAITELNQMVLWFFEGIPDFKPEVGFETQFTVSSISRDFLHVWEIIEVIPEELIVYKWTYPEYFDGDSFVTFKLAMISENQTTLSVIADGMENYPQDIPEFKRESGVNGWNYFIKESLSNYLKSLK